MTLREELSLVADKSKLALPELLALGDLGRKDLLLEIANGLDSAWEEISIANAIDVELARDKGLASPLVDRLTLTRLRFDSMLEGVRVIAALPDPIGEKLSETIRPNGLIIRKVRCPLGVVCIVYESRPNVTIDSTALCLRSANSVILRGGSEALSTNRALVNCLISVGQRFGLPDGAVQLIDSSDRQAITILSQLEGQIDLLIPRGGEQLIRAVTNNAKVPVIKHYKGVCHVYVDSSAHLESALDIIENAKCQRPGVCNALETLLVHQEIANSLLPELEAKLKSRNVELRGDPLSNAILPNILRATEQDWHDEYLALILAIKIVPSLEDAIWHINNYGSHHSDSILSQDPLAIEKFQQQVDSAVVYSNASTRFTDGFEFGLGAEIGISTDKLHSRGPMALEGLTTYKFLVTGEGHIRS